MCQPHTVCNIDYHINPGKLIEATGIRSSYGFDLGSLKYGFFIVNKSVVGSQRKMTLQRPQSDCLQQRPFTERCWKLEIPKLKWSQVPSTSWKTCTFTSFLLSPMDCLHLLRCHWVGVGASAFQWDDESHRNNRFQHFLSRSCRLYSFINFDEM